MEFCFACWLRAVSVGGAAVLVGQRGAFFVDHFCVDRLFSSACGAFSCVFSCSCSPLLLFGTFVGGWGIYELN